MTEAQMLERLATLLEPVQYRDVTFGVQPSVPPFTPSVTYWRQVEDAWHPHRFTTFGGAADVWPSMLAPGNEGQFYDWLFKCVVLDMEQHEAAEWFLVAGVRIFDPHKEGR